MKLTTSNTALMVHLLSSTLVVESVYSYYLDASLVLLMMRLWFTMALAISSPSNVITVGAALSVNLAASAYFLLVSLRVARKFRVVNFMRHADVSTFPRLFFVYGVILLLQLALTDIQCHMQFPFVRHRARPMILPPATTAQRPGNTPPTPVATPNAVQQSLTSAHVRVSMTHQEVE
ncbi:hypothetical protein DIPPA_14513 [Diplonema papillatum]|nr:hypothetical protein DIPPA_14513 [Diplonema papillatum]KAJ9455149.1 hypothetical protein DIPPA_14513 [Diplonema papillatum]